MNLSRRDKWTYAYSLPTYIDRTLADTVEKRIGDIFRIKDFRLLSSIPSTGRALLWASIPKDKEYEVAPREIRDIITHNMGQSRIETFTRYNTTLTGGMYVLDGVFMYASCLSHLPVGRVIHDTKDDFSYVYLSNGMLYPHEPGFYLVESTVPYAWKHIGLVQSERGRGTLAHESGIYPHEPLSTFTNWLTAAEVALIANNGWYIGIRERILWPDTNDIPDPLRTWMEKLVDLWHYADSKEEAGFYRDLVIQTIGSFHQKSLYNEEIIPRSDLPLKFVPDRIGALDKDGLHIWHEVQLPPQRQVFMRPEWSATIWGRARTRVVSMALTFPFDSIISLRSDSIWLSKLDDRDFTSLNIPGDFRVKDYIPGPIQWPKTSAEMRRLVVTHNKEKKENNE